jgi:hypothetical protein
VGRILRAEQSGPAGAVEIKQAQSSRTPNAPMKFKWDGSDEQLRSAIECKLQVFARRMNHSLPGSGEESLPGIRPTWYACSESTLARLSSRPVIVLRLNALHFKE